MSGPLYPDPNRAPEEVLLAFAGEVDRALQDRIHPRPPGGIEPPYRGDFSGASLPVLHRLIWWVREFRESIERLRAEKGRPR